MSLTTLEEIRVHAEGEWIVGIVDDPALDGLDEFALLAADGPGRVAVVDGRVFRMAEVRRHRVEPFEESVDRLRVLLDPSSPPPMTLELEAAGELLDAVMDGLTESDESNSDADDEPDGPRVDRVRNVSLVFTPYEDHVRVESTLAEWDELEPESRTAIARFLLGNRAAVRLGRTELGERSARIVAETPYARLEQDLPSVVGALPDHVRRLSREVEALRFPELAGVYLAAVPAVAPNAGGS